MLGSATATIVEFSGINIVPRAAVTRTERSLGCAPAPLMSAGLLCGAQPCRERLQEVPADGPVALHERAEIPVRQSPADEVGRGRDRRRARAFVNHRELPER